MHYFRVLFLNSQERIVILEDERILLSQARSLDQDALTQIHNRYYARVYRYIDYRVHDAQCVEDLTSEVFTRFLKSLRDRQVLPNSLQGWLLGVAKNVLREHYRIKGRDDWSPLGEGEISSSPTPAEMVDKQLMNEQLREAMEELTEDQKQVLALRFGFDMPVKQVAKTMEKSEGSIKMLQTRAVARLTQLLYGQEAGA